MSWTIDTAHSSVEFSVKHMMIATVRGRFTEFAGTVVLNEQNPEASSAEGWVEINSVDTRDAARDAHLRSGDFFDAEAHPRMTFRSTRIRRTGGDSFKVAGEMTIRGVTREVVFDVTYEGENMDPWGNRRRGFTAQTSFNRKDFGLTWNVALETGGVLVAEQVKVNVEMELIYQAQPETEAQPEEAVAA
jgi:polyisoprenoid-binding protein YceI